MFRILNCNIPQKFPKLRFGFIETAASWVPWVIYELRRRLDTVNKKLPNDLLEKSGILILSGVICLAAWAVVRMGGRSDATARA